MLDKRYRTVILGRERQNPHCEFKWSETSINLVEKK
jgi:hypothetical protein